MNRIDTIGDAFLAILFGAIATSTVGACVWFLFYLYRHAP